MDVLPGNAPDKLGALELVEQSEASADVPVAEAMGDTAYGDGGTRQVFADAGRKLVARVPGRPNRKHFPKEDFVIDLAQGRCACPAGQITRTVVPAGKRTDSTGTVHRLQVFRFDGAVCQGCPLRIQCIAAKGTKGRQVLIHPQESLLQAARALQQSADYDQYRQRRVAAGASTCSAGAVGHPEGALLRTGQDQVPVVPGGYGGQLDPVGQPNRCFRRCRR